VAVGESVTVLGQTIPNSSVEVWLYPKMDGMVPEAKIVKKKEEIAIGAKWQITIPTTNLESGNYLVKARAYLSDTRYSDFGNVLNCGIGTTGEGDTCARSDLSKDGKINLLDFSILMYNWSKTGSAGDINRDGKVNLIDFSMMMYCWTG
jgi:hypothetical protein